MPLPSATDLRYLGKAKDVPIAERSDLREIFWFRIPLIRTGRGRHGQENPLDNKK
jgi:hypothetical protein